MVMGNCIPHHNQTMLFVFTPGFYTHQGTRTSKDALSLRIWCDTVILMKPMSEMVWNLNWICNAWYSPLVVPLFQRLSHMIIATDG